MDVVNALLTLVVLGVLVVGGLVVYGAYTFYAAKPAGSDTVFTVERGNNLSTVGQHLEEKGLIDNRYVFQLGGFALRKQGQLKTGEYEIPAGASMYDILRVLTEGKPVQLDVTIPEGFTVAQVIDRLNRNDKLTGEITDPPPEGSLLPDTYDFDPGATRQSVLKRMSDAMTNKLAEIWQDRDPAIPVSTPEQLVTLASIVEKETPVASERAHIAGVYYNRLVKHMRLQSDPTVVYGITKGAGPTGRAPTRAELDQATSYNTYQINGLPPGPIANPGVEALTAAAHPTRSPDAYFVAASLNPKDGHLFAANYADHRKNVAKLRVIEKQQAAADAEADADNAKDQLEEQQAAAAGDPTATQTADSGQQPLPTTPDASGNPIPTLPQDDGTAPAAPAQPTTPAPAQAAPAGDPNAPVPMPSSDRPGADAAAPAAPAAAPAEAAPAAKPPTRPARPRQPAPQDVFGG